jgi:hypothetical protein
MVCIAGREGGLAVLLGPHRVRLYMQGKVDLVLLMKAEDSMEYAVRQHRACCMNGSSNETALEFESVGA